MVTDLHASSWILIKSNIKSGRVGRRPSCFQLDFGCTSNTKSGIFGSGLHASSWSLVTKSSSLELDFSQISNVKSGHFDSRSSCLEGPRSSEENLIGGLQASSWLLVINPSLSQGVSVADLHASSWFLVDKQHRIRECQQQNFTPQEELSLKHTIKLYV